MNQRQEKAAKTCREALEKVAAADLAVYLFDGALYVVPREIHPSSHDDAIEACELFGEDITPAGLLADCGAGV